MVRKHSQDYGDPVRLMRTLARLRAVSSLEDRMLKFLTDYWNDARERFSLDPQRLVVTPIGDGQLMVRWHGTSERTIAWMAHTDREGYVVHRHELDRIGINLYARLPSGAAITDRIPLGSMFNIDSGHLSGDKQMTVPGMLIGLSEDRKSIIIRVPIGRDTDTLVRMLQDNEIHLSATHHFSISLGEEIVTDLIASECVDNVAGVACVTSALLHVARRRLDCSVAVVYSTGEELGMIGAQSIVKKLPPGAEDWLWIVIDSSSRQSSTRVQVNEWLESFMSRKHPDEPRAKFMKWSQCPGADVSSATCAVRLEDAISCFDKEACVRLRHICLQTRHNLLHNEGSDLYGIRDYQPAIEQSLVSQLGGLGQCGVFYGGQCEGSVLTNVQEVAPHLHTKTLRVAAIAIPIDNYRLYVAGRVEPEAVRATALWATHCVLVESAVLFPGIEFLTERTGGHRGTAEMSMILRRAYPDRNVTEHWAYSIDRLGERYRSQFEEFSDAAHKHLHRFWDLGGSFGGVAPPSEVWPIAQPPTETPGTSGS